MERRRCRSATRIPYGGGLDAEAPSSSREVWWEESQSRSDVSYGRRRGVHDGHVGNVPHGEPQYSTLTMLWVRQPSDHRFGVIAGDELFSRAGTP